MIKLMVGSYTDFGTRVFISAPLAGFPVYVGIQHNAMGECCLNGDLDICDFDYFYAAMIWFSWFIVLSVPTTLVTVIFRFCISRYKALAEKS